MMKLKKIEGRIYYHLNNLFEPDFTNEFFIPNKNQFYQYTIKTMGIILILSLLGTSFACLESEHKLIKENINGKLFNTIIFTLLSYLMILKSMHNLYKKINNPHIVKIVIAKIFWIVASFTLTMVVIKSLNLNAVFMSVQHLLNQSGYMVLENNVKLCYGLSILSLLFVVFEGGFSLIQMSARTKFGSNLLKNVFKINNQPEIKKQIIVSDLVKTYNYEQDFKVINTNKKESLC